MDFAYVKVGSTDNSYAVRIDDKVAGENTASGFSTGRSEVYMPITGGFALVFEGDGVVGKG